MSCISALYHNKLKMPSLLNELPTGNQKSNFAMSSCLNLTLPSSPSSSNCSFLNVPRTCAYHRIVSTFSFAPTEVCSSLSSLRGLPRINNFRHFISPIKSDHRIAPIQRYLRSPAMASLADGVSSELTFSSDNNRLLPIQLDDESDFEKIVTAEDYISICGFGSLLSERSARSTFPELMNFRVARLQGFRRVFAHAAPIFFERGIAKVDTKEISSLSVEPCEGETLVVTVFEIPKSEIPAFIKRELEFLFLAVLPETLDGKPFSHCAVLCAHYSDEEFFRVRCRGSKVTYDQIYGKCNISRIWRDDILPCRTYLRHCVLAAKNLGDEPYNNFLDHTYLGDRKTMIREYLSTTGLGIMDEEPPESLKARYGG